MTGENFEKQKFNKMSNYFHFKNISTICPQTIFLEFPQIFFSYKITEIYF